MNVPSIVVALLVTLGCVTSQSGVDGVYATPREVAAFYGETLELREGRFALWSYSDVQPQTVRVPVRGAYRIENGYVILEGADVHSPHRMIVTFQGQRLLLREDSVDAWQTGQKLYPYGCLMRTAVRPDAVTFMNRPSVKSFGVEHVAEYQ